jgi:DNA-binding MarR family transcriptional regulator
MAMDREEARLGPQKGLTININQVNNNGMGEPLILELIYSAHRRLAELEGMPRDYGTGELLYASDIHALEAVACHEEGNLTELASALGISMPAAHKATGRMIEQGYLGKRKREDNAKEVLFYLREKGKKAVRGHRRFEKRVFAPLRELEAGLSEKDRRTVCSFLEALENACSW